MNRMSRRTLNRTLRPLFAALSVLCLSLACALLPCAPACHAETVPHLERHARKIHKRLARFAPGKFLHLIFRDDSQRYGSLGELTPVSFRFTDADTNAAADYAYADVSRIKTDKEYIGEGTAPERHIRHLVPILIGAAAAGGAAAYLAMR